MHQLWGSAIERRSPKPAPIKVFYVINGLGTGGTQRSLVEMLPTFLDEGITPVLICLGHEREGAEQYVIEQGFDVRFLRSHSLLGKALELRKSIRAERPHLVHSSIFEADLIGRLACRRLKTPVLTSLVHTPYDPVRRTDPNVRPLRMEIIRLIDAWTARRFVTHFHAVTSAVKDAAIQSLRLPPDRITVIGRDRNPTRLGEPSADRRHAARASLGLGDHRRVLINVARQEYQKGQRFLLEALADLAPRFPSLMLVVAGRRGHMSRELEQTIADRGLEDHVLMLGHREDVPELLAAGDIFVFPSLYEGVAGALIEAMALGLPVVATDLPTLKEVVEPGGNAILVPPASPTALSWAIERLLENPELATAFGRRSREIFYEHHAGNSHALAMVALYRQLVPSGRGTR